MSLFWIKTMATTSPPVSPTREGSLSPKKSFSEALSTTNRKIEKISLMWEDINLYVRSKDATKSNLLNPVYKDKRILRSLYGRATSGELLAIMGPTGCGKTSLMNVLAARVAGLSDANSRLTGTVLVNGIPRDDEAFRRISAYVLQVSPFLLLCFFQKTHNQLMIIG